MIKLANIYKNILNETKMLSLEAFTNNLDMSNCDCCDYFDFDFGQAGGYFAGLKHPIYYELQKDERHTLKFISPKQYIYAIARGFGGLSWDDVTKSGAVSDENVKKYAEAMKRGDKFPIGWYKEGRGSQEGRHRALAAIELGCNSIPVVVMQEVSYEEKKSIAKSLQGFSREQVNQVYVDKGYDGITNLDWNNLQRFIEYNL